MGNIETAIALAGDMRANDTRSKNAVAGIGEHHIIGNAIVKRKGLLPRFIGRGIDVPSDREGIAGILDFVLKADDNRSKLRHDYQAPFC